MIYFYENYQETIIMHDGCFHLFLIVSYKIYKFSNLNPKN